MRNSGYMLWGYLLHIIFFRERGVGLAGEPA